jgi:hypothetical protein
MPNIGIHGYEYDECKSMEQRIGICLQKIGLGDDAITEMFRSVTKSCDGKNKPMPYLEIFSSEIDNVRNILVGFEELGIHEDIQIISEKIMFFSKDEIASRKWREKFRLKMGWNDF